MDSVLIAFRSGPPAVAPAGVPTLQPMASDPPGFEGEGSRVYVGDATAYLRDMWSDAAGPAALAEGLALLPWEGPPSFLEVLYSGGASALRALLASWLAAADAVVWDSEDRPSRLLDFLSRL